MVKNEVLCCFSGKWIPIEAATEIHLRIPRQENEYQTLYVEKSKFFSHIVASVPIHPNFLE